MWTRASLTLTLIAAACSDHAAFGPTQEVPFASLAAGWSIVDLGAGPPPYGGRPNAIARSGLIGGATFDPFGSTAFVRHIDGSFRLLSNPTGTTTAQVNGINSAGMATGAALTSNVGGTSIGVLWATKTADVVRQLSGGSGQSVSETGFVVGRVLENGSYCCAYRWRPEGPLETLATPYPATVFASAVNDNGVVAGSVYAFPAFWRTPADVVVLPLPSGFMSGVARAINNRGDLAISLWDHGSDPYIARWTQSHGLEVLALPPGTVLAEAIGIDDSGRVYANIGDFQTRLLYAWSGTSLVRLPTVSPLQMGIAVNGCGQVVGIDNRTLHTILWDRDC